MTEKLNTKEEKLDIRAFNYGYQDDVDPHLEFFYKPRNLTFLVAFISGLVYIAMFVLKDDQVFNTKVGLWTAFSFLLVTGLLQFKDGPFIRPHPALWRIVMVFGVAYEMCLVIVLFQNKDHARQLFKFIDPTLGVPLPEKSYGDACELTWTNVWDQTDIFVLAHTFGWFAKALVLRDYWLCWVISVMFEVMEYTLQHQLPNFAECWWDHWIMDVLLANWLGIWFGMKTCEYFEMKHYSFRGIDEMHTVKEKLSRGMLQFTPHSWTKFEWGSAKTFKRYVSVIGLIVVVLMIELNAFYLKTLLWIPVSSRLNLWRLILVFFLCMPACRDYYQYITDPKCKRLGFHCWMLFAVTFTECLIILKFSPGEFTEPFPQSVIDFWTVFGSCFAIYTLWKFIIKPSFSSQKSKTE